MKKALLIGFFYSLIFQVFAERQMVYKYAVFFTHKDNQVYHYNHLTTFLSEKATARKQQQGIAIDERDLPVSMALLDTLKAAGFIVNGVSRWLNCAIVFSDKKNDEPRLKALYGVKAAELVGYEYKRSKPPIDLDLSMFGTKKEPDSLTLYGKAWWQNNMIGANQLHQNGLLGQGVTVAVIDAGFKHADRIEVLKNAMPQVIATYDFVDRELNVFDDDEHGTAVWSCMAANDSFFLVGTAPRAAYLLLRSEDAGTEFPVEEFYWIVAAEFADSAGADMISSSLGYTEFDNERFNHTDKDMFRLNTWISKGAKIAIEKGLLVVNSSGNEGDKDWKLLAFPADVDEVITVGAVDANGFVADFSSVGVKGGKCLKPDAMAPGKGVYVVSASGNVYAGNGTSYSCPILAGGLACLWPLLKGFPQQQVKQLLALSSNYYNEPGIYAGHGIPDLWLLYQFALAKNTDTIFDVRKLNNKYLHLAGNVSQPTELIINISTDNKEVLISQNIAIEKSGCFRVELNKSNALKPGSYQLMYNIQQKKYTLPFKISLHENN